MDWDDLQSFLAIARHGSLSAAARALQIQQSTMGRRLAALEGRIGTRLLERTAAGFVPTPAGEAILGNVERIENEALAIARTLTGKDISLEGTIRLTTIETFATHLLPPIIAEFQDRHPRIAIEVLSDYRALSLTRREADVALRLARPTQIDLAARKLGLCRFGLYAAQSYLSRHGIPNFSTGAPGHRVISNAPHMTGFTEMDWFAALAARAHPVLLTASHATQRAAAANGIGIACIPRFLGDASGLVRLETPTEAPARELWLAVHADLRHTPRIRALIDALAAGIRARLPDGA